VIEVDKEAREVGDVVRSMELLVRSMRDPLLLKRRFSSFSSALMVAVDAAFPGVGIMLALPVAVPGPTDIRLGAVAGGAAPLRLFNDSNSLSFNRNM
jgi:hypothetical protein